LRAIHRCIIELSSSIVSCPSRHRLAVQRFIAEPSIAKPSIAEPSSALSPSRPSQAVIHHELSIATLPSHLLRHCRAVQRFIAEPSIAKPTIAIATSPSRPSQHRRAVHCELSIATSTSRPSLHGQAVVVVHCELSIATSPSHPALYLYRQAVQRFIDEPSIVSCPS